MNLLRRLTYWLGFNPKLGTILHSPSGSMKNAALSIHGGFMEGIMAALKERDDGLQDISETAYDDLPPTPPDGTRGPQGHWFGGHFYFDCMTEPILPDEVKPRA